MTALAPFVCSCARRCSTRRFFGGGARRCSLLGTHTHTVKQVSLFLLNKFIICQQMNKGLTTLLQRTSAVVSNTRDTKCTEKRRSRNAIPESFIFGTLSLLSKFVTHQQSELMVKPFHVIASVQITLTTSEHHGIGFRLCLSWRWRNSLLFPL